VVRHVADDNGTIERMPQRVGVLDAHARQPPPEGAHAVLVDVDRGEVSSERCEWTSAASGTVSAPSPAPISRMEPSVAATRSTMPRMVGRWTRKFWPSS
jgi:hypothetical protein